MKCSRPIVSVVIPTYNRYKYLYDCIDATRSVESDELEIIIQDNTPDNNAFVAYMEQLSDPRIKYYHKVEHVSVGENCDMGVAHATGEYVCIIGDDDTICSNIIQAAHYLKDNGIEGCSFPFPGFNWPDMTFENGKEKEPNMFFQKAADGSVMTIDPRKELKEHGCKGGLGQFMPRLYHAMVSKACLDRIYKKAGTYHPGPSPDMANAAATCLVIGKAVYISDYLIVSGYGHASARGEGNRNAHFGRIQDKPWLPKDIMEKWDKDTPPIFSGETIVAQSAIQAMKTMEANPREYRFDYTGLYATFFWHHKPARKEFIAFIVKSPKRIVWFIKGVFSRARLKFQGVEKKRTFYLSLNGIGSLYEAKCLTEEKTAGLKYHLSS